MKYHDVIIDLICYILNQGEAYLFKIDSGNAFDKILRNYHQFNYNGEKVYRNLSRMEEHYRFSKNAWENRANKKNLYFEHLVPIKLIKSDLKDLILESQVSPNNIRSILDDTEIVVITRKEAKRIDKFHKTTVPKSGNDRLKENNILIAEETRNNNLFDSAE